MPLDSIKSITGRDGKTYTYYPTLILGAGESGIALACRLKQKLGTDQFRLFDRQAGIGGTWWINRYPGVACDVPAVFYSFSFAQKSDWSGFYPPGPEFAKYLLEVCAKYQILDKIQLNTDVAEARWLEDEEVWEVTLNYLRPGTGDLSEQDRQKLIQEHGEQHVYLGTEVVRAKIFASAAGVLVNPKPWTEDLPGKNEFEGEIFHSARWDYSVDLTDKDVIVVGSGCSAAQFVGRLTKPPYNAKSVTQIMRSPPWVSPKFPPPGGHAYWQKWGSFLLHYVPGVRTALRAVISGGAEIYFFKHFGDTESHAKARIKTESGFLEYMKENVPEKYHEILTPDYSLGCKRFIIDQDWFAGLTLPKVDLTTRPLSGIQRRGVTLGPGRAYPNPDNTQSSVPTDEVQLPADVIVLANGFEVGEWLHPLKVTGKGEKDLNEVWRERGGAQAYLGTAMDGFPNFFLIVGPNTATGHTSVILATENMVKYSLNFIKPVLNGDASQVEVTQEAEMRWTKDIQSELSRTVWAKGGCRSWYKTEEGWNSSVYPYSQIRFAYKCMFPQWGDWRIQYTRTGLLKHRSRQALKIFASVVAIIGVGMAQLNGYGLMDIPNFATYLAQRALDGMIWSLNLVRSRV
ncbi:MAG: hypothetical protein M1837_004943 [Sclerophora amabilis]|nr:MAG: hypothetical protein M1837_004943 [Sclerophora amabilis]